MRKKNSMRFRGKEKVFWRTEGGGRLGGGIPNKEKKRGMASNKGRELVVAGNNAEMKTARPLTGQTRGGKERWQNFKEKGNKGGNSHNTGRSARKIRS